MAALDEVVAAGAKNVLLTMGGKGAYFTDGEGVWRCGAARIEPFQTACAGDGTLGAFLSAWYDDRSNVEGALVRAMATGANVALCPGLGDFARVDELASRVSVERIR